MIWINIVIKITTYQYCFCCRNLVKPIAVQSKEKEDRYVDTYKVVDNFFFLQLSQLLMTQWL